MKVFSILEGFLVFSFDSHCIGFGIIVCCSTNSMPSGNFKNAHLSTSNKAMVLSGSYSIHIEINFMGSLMFLIHFVMFLLFCFKPSTKSRGGSSRDFDLHKKCRGSLFCTASHIAYRYFGV